MLRAVFALLSGSLFGAGLLLSGMTDTTKVQGWLDVFGAWDPTLAFVLGGAIVPMTLAWRIANARKISVLGTPFPARVPMQFDPALIIGSALFGAGWALAGLCPGPALASISYGGWGGAVFLLAMLAAMLITPALTRILPDLSPVPSQGTKMDIRALTDAYAVSPQIAPDHLPTIKAAGFTTIIDNRPDTEIPGDLHAATMRRAAEAIGLTFIANPIIGGGMTQANVETQKAAIAAATGPVFAYCASGNRCSQVWALANAGTLPTDDLINIPARFGYQLEGLRQMLDAAKA